MKSPGTPPVKLSEVEQENLEETTNRKPSLGNEASSSSSTSAREDHTHLDTVAKVVVGTKETSCLEWSRVGGGSDVGGLYKPQDYGINRRRTNGKRQSSRFLPSGAKGFEAFADWPRGLRQEMKTINALNLQPAVALASIKLEIRRKSYKPKRQSLARVDELKAEENPDRRSTDSKLEPLEVNSDSGSVASSDAAFRFLRFACPFDSSENEPLESDVPTCNSLTFESDDGDESVGSSSVADPGVPPTTDGRGGAGGRTAGGGLAADGEATQSKEDDLRMWLREDVLEKGGIYDMPDREGRLPGCETARKEAAKWRDLQALGTFPELRESHLVGDG